MGAEFRAFHNSVVASDEGQSVLEFVLMLPLLVGLAVMVVRVNTPIQMSIVNQQYARAQSLYLAANSPVFPVLRLRQSDFIEKGYNQMVIGVSENAPPDRSDGGSRYSPIASTFKITRKPGGSQEAGEEHTERSEVRIRNTAHICTQSNVISVGDKRKPILPIEGDEKQGFRPSGINELIGKKLVNFQYCRSPLNE